MSRTCIISILILMILGCKESEAVKPRTEVLEVYDTKNDGNGFVKGDMKFYESKNYRGEKLLETLFYNGQGENIGKEVMIYESKKNAPRSEYYDPANNLLSYYTYEYNDQNLKITKRSFQGDNDELIRIERYYYEGDDMVKREIRNAFDVVQRTFNFTYDPYGNETQMIVINQQNDTIAIETYEIIRRDSSQQWVEKWGFSNDQPSTYHIIKR